VAQASNHEFGSGDATLESGFMDNSGERAPKRGTVYVSLTFYTAPGPWFLGYWDLAPDGPPTMLENAPGTSSAHDALKWALARSNRVFVQLDDPSGTILWAGKGEPPGGIGVFDPSHFDFDLNEPPGNFRPVDIHPERQYTSDKGEAIYWVEVEQSPSSTRTLIMDFGDNFKEERSVPPGRSCMHFSFHHQFPQRPHLRQEVPESAHDDSARLSSHEDSGSSETPTEAQFWEQRATIVETGDSWTASTFRKRIAKR
jgi:hypothetical protein